MKWPSHAGARERQSSGSKDPKFPGESQCARRLYVVPCHFYRTIYTCFCRSARGSKHACLSLPISLENRATLHHRSVDKLQSRLWRAPDVPCHRIGLKSTRRWHEHPSRMSKSTVLRRVANDGRPRPRCDPAPQNRVADTAGDFCSRAGA